MSIVHFISGHIHTQIHIRQNDSWIELCDIINKQIFNDTNISRHTMHYNHSMYYLIFMSSNGSMSTARCCSYGLPYEQINSDYPVRVKISSGALCCCKCFTIPCHACAECGYSRNNNETSPQFVHSLNCGHEILCSKCADKLPDRKLLCCPYCNMECDKLCNTIGKCPKCRKFTCDCHCL